MRKYCDIISNKANILIFNRRVISMFDENNIILRAAVISDPHISYTGYSTDEIVDKFNGYASAIADLHDISGGALDAVVMCGDYTSIGCAEQARTFAQGTRVIFDEIFRNNPPKLLIGMGNHDTCWNQKHYHSMHAKEWYEIFDEYGLTADFSDKSDKEEGNIRIDTEKDGRQYTFLYVETDWYAENRFKPETLKWLDDMLLEVTSQNPHRFVYIGMHAPVLESGIYGTDKALESGTDWATSKNNIDKVLSKYPQAVIFSGHTHFAAELETTIMQKNYTAVNVPPVLTHDHYTTFTQPLIDDKYETYLDSTYPDNQYGTGMYIEIDGSDNIRITRVNFTRNRAKCEVLTSETKDNPAVGTWPGEPEKFSWLELKSCSVGNNEQPSFTEPAWIIDAPDDNKEFLTKYSKQRGRIKPPSFPKTAEIQAEKSAQGSCKVTFSAAESSAYILFYRITISNSETGENKEFRVLGNWVDIKKGAVGGNTHKDAKAFEYVLPPVISDNECCTLSVSAVDEYGNESEPLTAKPL